MTYLKKFLNTIKAEPVFFVAGVSVLLLAIMGTSVRHVASSTFAILVLLSFTTIKDWWKLYLSLSSLEKIFLLSFLFYTISGVLAFYNVDDIDKYFKIFERYFRFLMVVPIYLFFIKRKVFLLNYLFTGAVISGPFLLVVAVNYYLENPNVPAQGYYHHIIFGQLAMLNVGIMLSLLLTRKLNRRIQLMVIAFMLCGIVTAIMSQARGVWLVLPVYVLIVVYYAVKDKRLSLARIAMFFLIVVFLSILTPISDVVKQRTLEAVTEVSHFYTEDQYISSVGTRLAMWDIAFDVWKRHPLLGTGLGDFDDEILALQKKGEYTGMDVHNSVHNIYIQALVGSGLVGLIALLLAVLFVPLKIFLDKKNSDKTAGLAGFVTIISFAIFGVSESWTLRLPAVSVFLVYITVIVSHIQITGRDDIR